MVPADGVHDSAGCHQLDPAGAKFDVAADDATDIVDGVYLVGLVEGLNGPTP
jgi:hypothetical protein